MLLARVLVLALLVACACLARAADDSVPDIDYNEVLPENDVVRARVDEVLTDAPVTKPAPSSTRIPQTTPTSTADPGADVADKGAPTTTAPPPARPQGTFTRFLSDIIQIPIAVLRSVGGLLSSTFSRNRGSTASPTNSSGPLGSA